MKKTFITFWKSILAILLGVLGFAACSDENGGGMAEYGTPSALFKVKGKIYSQTENKEMKDIKVILSEYNSIETFMNDTAYTTQKGEFNLEIGGFPTDCTLLLKIEDVDGNDNGSWKARTDTVKFTKPSFKNGRGNWYKGETEKDLGIIYLEPGQEGE